MSRPSQETAVNFEQCDRIRASFDTLSTREWSEVAERFYATLLGENPPMRSLFPRDLREHALRSATALGILVRNMQRLESLSPMLAEMGATNLRRGTQPQHYGVFRETMLRCIRESLGDQWSETLEDDWSELLNTVAAMMLRGAGRARGKAA